MSQEQRGPAPRLSVQLLDDAEFTSSTARAVAPLVQRSNTHLRIKWLTRVTNYLALDDPHRRPGKALLEKVIDPDPLLRSWLLKSCTGRSLSAYLISISDCGRISLTARLLADDCRMITPTRLLQVTISHPSLNVMRSRVSTRCREK